MTDAQSQHASELTLTFADLLWKKYERGAREHGGNLWEKEGLLDMAIDEAVDQVVYLLTLKQQLYEKKQEGDHTDGRGGGNDSPDYPEPHAAKLQSTVRQVEA